MENSVIFSNPLLLIPLIIAALLWLWSHRKKNKVMPVISYLIATAVMVFGALNKGLGFLPHLPIHDCPLDIGVAEDQKSGKEHAGHNGD